MQKKIKIRIAAVFTAVLCIALNISALASGQWNWNEDQHAWYYDNVEAAAEEGLQTGETWTGWIQESGLWYYIENSRMMTGWVYTGGQFYYLKDDGVMAANEWIGNFYCGADGAVLKDCETPDGYRVDENGAWISQGESTEPGTPYLEVAKANPQLFATFGEANNGEVRISIENGKYCFKAMQIFGRPFGDGSYNPSLYMGDAFINPEAVVTIYTEEGTEIYRYQEWYRENVHFRAVKVQFNPAGYLTAITIEE